MINNIKDFFLKPTHITQKRYEAMRALCVENIKAKDVAKRFGYSVFSINAMKRDFAKGVKDNKIFPDDFFVTKQAGRNPDKDKATLREKIIQLRKQNHSILDIKSVLHSEGKMVSHDYIDGCCQWKGLRVYQREPSLREDARHLKQSRRREARL